MLTDVEYDAFIAGQGSDSEQILVVCISSVQKAPSPYSFSSDILDQLHRKTNRKRNMPCTQVKSDMLFILCCVHIYT